MADLARIQEYLNKAKVFYFTTVDGDKPKCRPFGFSMVENDKLYFGTGTFKDCFKQIEKNPNIEVVAMGAGGWLRLYGKAVIVNDDALSQKALDTMPQVKKIYEANGFKLGMFYLENATAEFRDLMSVKEKIEF